MVRKRRALLALAAAAFVAAGGSPALAAPIAVEFDYLDGVADRVAVVGDWNGWAAEAQTMRREGLDRWRLETSLEPGRYEYAFLVDGRTLPDPRNPRIRPAGDRSVLLLRGADDVPRNFSRRLVRHLFEVPDRGNRAAAVAGEFNRWNPAANPLRLDPGDRTWRGVYGVAPVPSDLNFVVDGVWRTPDLDDDPARYFVRPEDPSRFRWTTGYVAGPIEVWGDTVEVRARLLPPADTPAASAARWRVRALRNDEPVEAAYDDSTGIVRITVRGLAPGPNVVEVGADSDGIRAVPAFFDILRPAADEAAAGAAVVDREVAFTLSVAAIPGAKPSRAAVAGSFNAWSAAADPMRYEEGAWRATLRLAPGAHEYKFVLDGDRWISDPANPLQVGPYGNSLLQVADSSGNVPRGNEVPKSRIARDAILYQVMVPRFADSDDDGVGDLRGLADRIPYIADLGVNWIYLLPVFRGPSRHGYHTTDYRSIDPALGTFEDFRRVVETAHAHGVRVMLDYVFHHSSADHPVFRRAFADAASPWRAWHRWKGADEWEGFGGGRTAMPGWNFRNAAVRRYAIDVARFWQDQGVDGFRCDVAHSVPDDFWREWATALKRRDPDVLLFPEFDEPYFDLYYDDVLIKVFDVARGADVALLGGALTAEGAEGRIPVRYLDYHDRDRARTLAGGDTEAVMLGVALLLTSPGVPMLYYGEEFGMEGSMDRNTNREMMDWDFGDRLLAERYRRLLRLRRDHAALRGGTARRLRTDDPRVFAFERRDGAERLVVALRFGAGPATTRIDVGEGARAAESLLEAHPEAAVEGGRLRIDLRRNEAAVVRIP